MLEDEIEELGMLPCKWPMTQGNFSQVAAAVDPKDGQYVVCKLFTLETHAKKQAAWMKRCNTLRIRSVPKVRWIDGRMIVYTMAIGETLIELARRQCSEAEAVSAALAVVAAVFELARNGIHHGDLHPGNLLINSSIATLIDPAQDTRCDDADSAINAFASVGFISHYGARDCGVMRPSSCDCSIFLERHLPSVRDVLCGLAPTLRKVTREARRRAAEVEPSESSGAPENLAAGLTESQEGTAK